MMIHNRQLRRGEQGVYFSFVCGQCRTEVASEKSGVLESALDMRAYILGLPACFVSGNGQTSVYTEMKTAQESNFSP